MKRVLIISRIENGPVYESILRQETIRCRASEAVTISSETDVGLMILECGAETFECMELLKNVKTGFPAIPVIFIDGSGFADVALQAYKCGARDYFRLPLDLDEFERSVGRILELRHEFQYSRISEVSVDDQYPPEGEAHLCPTPERLGRVLAYMEKKYRDPLTLTEIAHEACMSKYHFCRVFKRHFGMTPMHYLSDMRIRKAKSLLASSDLPVSMVAIRTGFTDLTEFNRQFKKMSGQTPTAFRKSAVLKSIQYPSSN